MTPPESESLRDYFGLVDRDSEPDVLRLRLFALEAGSPTVRRTLLRYFRGKIGLNMTETRQVQWVWLPHNFLRDVYNPMEYDVLWRECIFNNHQSKRFAWLALLRKLVSLEQKYQLKRGKA